jgi:DNA adenine methylase
MIERLRGVVIENKCALELMPQHDSDQTLFYVDPPYVHETRCTRQAYGFEMDDDDHRDMAEILRALRGKVVLSGYACPLYSELFGDWHCEQKAALGDGACDRTEVLWMNFDPTKHRPQMEML